MVDDVYSLEARDGVRCTWQTWPNNKATATRNVIPVSVVYTPLKEIETMALVEYEPVACPKCKGILNPFCPIDLIAKTWACLFCMSRNPFPPHYKAHISETTLPAELLPQYTTIEYILPQQSNIPPIFLFVLDICLQPDELAILKSTVQQGLNFLPAESLVGLVCFGKNVFVYDLSWTECTRCHAFRGDKQYDIQQIKEQLGLTGNDPRGIKEGAHKFLMPIQECEYTLNSIIEDLSRDSWPVPPGCRPLRSTGNALFVACTLLEIAYPRQGARVQLFSGGAASFGPGMIVGHELSDSIRTSNELKNDKAKYTKTASTFYEGLANRAAVNAHCIDIFCCAIDQIGLYEMRSLCDRTGGHKILAASFNSDIFRQSFQRIFERESTGALKMAFNGLVTLLPSADIKICGAIGPGVPLKTKNSFISDIEIGMSQANSWSLSSLDVSTTLAFFLDIASQEPNPRKNTAELQFQTRYQHASGRTRLRITTVRYPLVDQAQISKFISGFDQETAAVIMARWAVARTETEETIDVIRWVDRSLIRLTKKFAQYQHELPHTFRLCKEFSLYPQFMFHMRRSQFLQSFNVSPDESAYYRTHLLRENVTNSLLMIQPALLQYSFESPQPQPVLLDIASLKNNVILLLDTFFITLIWHGDMIVKWRNLGYQEKPEYENFKILLDLPVQDAQSIVSERFPVPRFVVTDCGKGDERILKSKVNPSGAGGNATVDSGNYFTEDVSLKEFTKHLIDFTVKS